MVSPAWVATAAQKESRRAAARRPWGTVHAKQVGASRTACGLPAANWYIFWDLSWDTAGRDACRECAALAVSGPDAPSRLDRRGVENWPRRSHGA